MTTSVSTLTGFAVLSARGAGVTSLTGYVVMSNAGAQVASLTSYVVLAPTGGPGGGGNASQAMMGTF